VQSSWILLEEIKRCVLGQLEIGHSGSRAEVTRRTYKLLRGSSSNVKVEENSIVGWLWSCWAVNAKFSLEEILLQVA
jgi:hypothetical protein